MHQQFCKYSAKTDILPLIRELKAKSESELQRLEKEYELKLDALKQSQQVDITSKFFTGELDINKLTQAVNGITELQKAVDKLSK